MIMGVLANNVYIVSDGEGTMVVDVYKRQVLVSPVWGAIEPAEIAAYLIDHGLDRARLQLQLHKIIWPDETRGV